MKMKSLCVVLLFALVAIVTLADADESSEKCTDNQDKCENNGQCCTGCCCKGRCAPANQCNRRPAHPCRNHKCEHGEVCVLRNVQCLRAPCNPIPVCVKRRPHPR